MCVAPAQGVRDSAAFAAVRHAVATCTICLKNAPAPAHAVVSMRVANSFNDHVAVDLFFLPGSPPQPVLHVIDLF